MENYLKIIDIAKVLNLTPADLKRAYDAWVAADAPESAPPANITTFNRPPDYNISEITTALDRDNNLKSLYKLAQTLLGKTLNTTEVQILYSLYDYYGFPVEVTMEMLTYAAKIGKRNMRYIEKIAIDWAEKGILTFDDATAYIKKLEQHAKRENKIKQALGIDRKLTESEEKFIRSWARELKVSLELVPIAYERTINGTGKLSCAYMDKIFKNWTAAGIKTAAQLETHEAEYKSSRTSNSGGAATVKPSKFNNFTETSGVDYTEAAKQKMNRG